MKKLFYLFICLPFITFAQSYGIGINDRLLTQLTINQGARIASNEKFFTSYEKQRKLYDKVNNKLTQINAINQLIYDQLRNVDSAIKQGKQLVYIYSYFNKIGTAGQEMIKLTAQNPQYAPLIYKQYERLYTDMMKLKEELSEEVLREENDFLMNPYDRQKLITHIYTRIHLIYGTILYINLYLKNAKEIPYIYQVPGLQTYANQDRAIVENILLKWKIFKMN